MHRRSGFDGGDQALEVAVDLRGGGLRGGRDLLRRRGLGGPIRDWRRRGRFRIGLGRRRSDGGLLRDRGDLFDLDDIRPDDGGLGGGRRIRLRSLGVGHRRASGGGGSRLWADRGLGPGLVGLVGVDVVELVGGPSGEEAQEFQGDVGGLDGVAGLQSRRHDVHDLGGAVLRAAQLQGRTREQVERGDFEEALRRGLVALHDRLPLAVERTLAPAAEAFDDRPDVGDVLAGRDGRGHLLDHGCGALASVSLARVAEGRAGAAPQRVDAGGGRPHDTVPVAGLEGLDGQHELHRTPPGHGSRIWGREWQEATKKRNRAC